MVRPNKYLLNFLCCILFLNCTSQLLAQAGNPFDIQGRESIAEPIAPIVTTPTTIDQVDSDLDSTNILEQTEVVETEIQQSTYDENNPFEIVRISNINVSPSTEPVQKKKTVLKDVSGSESSAPINNILFWIMTSILAGLALFITVFKSYLVKIYRSFLNHNFLRLTHREQRSMLVDFPYLFIYGLFFLNLSIFIFLGTTKFFPDFFSLDGGTLMRIGVSVIGIYAGKHLILNLINHIFDIKPEMNLYNFTIMIFNSVIGILLVPLNFGIAFASPQVAKSLIFIGLILIGLVLAFRSIRSLLLSMKLFSFHKFHFFIYLCAVELAPLIILTKYILLQKGIQ